MKRLILFLVLLTLTIQCHAAPIDKDYLNKIVSAIEKIENSKKYPFGIKSINTHGDYSYAKKICINTVSNNWKRWEVSDQNLDFLTFLANVYCPAKVDLIGNKNWIKNIHSLVK